MAGVRVVCWSRDRELGVLLMGLPSDFPGEANLCSSTQRVKLEGCKVGMFSGVPNGSRSCRGARPASLDGGEAAPLKSLAARATGLLDRSLPALPPGLFGSLTGTSVKYD